MVITPQLKLHDGMVLKDSRCGYADHNLWCWTKGLSMAETFAVFSDSGKTSTILFAYGDQKILYKGFTNIEAIQKSEFTIDVCLSGENTEIIENPEEVTENVTENT